MSIARCTCLGPTSRMCWGKSCFASLSDSLPAGNRTAITTASFSTVLREGHTKPRHEATSSVWGTDRAAKLRASGSTNLPCLKGEKGKLELPPSRPCTSSYRSHPHSRPNGFDMAGSPAFRACLHVHLSHAIRCCGGLRRLGLLSFLVLRTFAQGHCPRTHVRMCGFAKIEQMFPEM